MWLSKKDFCLKWNRNLHLHNLDCFPNKYSNEEEIMRMMPARAPLRGWGSSWSRRSVTLAFSRTVKSDTRVAHSQDFSHAHARLFYLDFWQFRRFSFLQNPFSSMNDNEETQHLFHSIQDIALCAVSCEKKETDEDADNERSLRIAASLPKWTFRIENYCFSEQRTLCTLNLHYYLQTTDTFSSTL